MAARAEPTGGEENTLFVRRWDGTPVPVRFLATGREAIVAAGDPLPRWATEAEGHSTLVVRFPSHDHWQLARTRELTPPELAVAREAFDRQFGSGFWDRHFGPRARAFSISWPEAEERRPAQDPVQEEFDALASSYADRIASQPVQRYLRARAQEILARSFPTPGRLIEFGPGAGAQTLPMLRAGHRLLAIDPSPRMVEELRQRAMRANVEAQLTTRVGTLGDASELLADQPDASFDGAFSFFGAVNLEVRLELAARPLARVLKPGARWVVGTLNRAPLVAVVELALAGHVRLAFQRLGPELEVDGYLRRLVVRPMNGTELAHRFADSFERAAAEPLSVVAPPFFSPRLEHFWGGTGAAQIARWDRWFCRFPTLSKVAEHLVVTLVRRP